MGLVALVLLGRSADTELTPVGPVLPPADQAAPPDDEPGPGFEPVDVPEPTDPYTPGVHPSCPEPAAVAAATGRSGSEVAAPLPAIAAMDPNGVPLVAEACEYGATASVARITGEDPDRLLHELLVSDGPFSVREVLVVDGEVLTVARNGQDHDGVDALVELVRAG